MFIGVWLIVTNVVLTTPAVADTVNEASGKSKEMIPFYWMIFIVGGCIALTLSYVSWKKYKGEKKKEKSKGKSVD